MRISSVGLIAAVSLGLGGCAYNGLGMGVGTGYGSGYGYGYDNYGYGYDRYGYGYGYSPYYSPYGYNPYGGWYNGYYYPGTGGWVYDRDGRRREVTPQEQAIFGRVVEQFREKAEQRRETRDGSVTTTTRVRQPARTRVIERTERPSATTQQSRRDARRAARAAAREDD